MEPTPPHRSVSDSAKDPRSCLHFYESNGDSETLCLNPFLFPEQKQQNIKEAEVWNVGLELSWNLAPSHSSQLPTPRNYRCDLGKGKGSI